jgi:hypothetical protein
MLKLMAVLESTLSLEELVLNAKASPREEDRALLNIMVIARLGLMTATQTETHMLKLMAVLVSMPLPRQV